MFPEVQLQSNFTAIFDADAIIYVAGWDKDNKMYYSDFEQIKETADKFISNILLDVKATHYVGFFGKGVTFRRLQVNTYKSNRDNLVKPKHFTDLKNYIVNTWGFQYVENIEADDAVRICKLNIPNSIILTTDKDVKYGIEGTHYDYKKGEYNTTSKEEAELFFYKQLIEGDTADGIKGLPGKGKKFAEQFFKDKTDYLSEVLKLYIDYYKSEYKGVEEFYKSYIQLKILEEYEGFIIPEPIKINNSLLKL